MARKTKSKRINSNANAVNTEDFLTGRDGITRRLIGLWAEQPGDNFIIGFIEQERVVEVGDDTTQADDNMIPIDRELAPGETFSAGYEDFSGGQTTNQHVTLIYDEE